MSVPMSKAQMGTNNLRQWAAIADFKAASGYVTNWSLARPWLLPFVKLIIEQRQLELPSPCTIIQEGSVIEIVNLCTTFKAYAHQNKLWTRCARLFFFGGGGGVSQGLR